MSFTPFSAKNAKVRLGAAVLTAKVWNVTSDVDELDTTNFESGGNYEWIGGIRKLTATIDFDIDASASLLDTTIIPGFVISNVKLYWQNTTGPFWDITTARVKTVTNPMNVKETGKCSITIIGSGAFVMPLGSFVPV